MEKPAHTPLPWRITEANEKKTREIVGANGATIARLTALDMPNAELIVSMAARIAELEKGAIPAGWQLVPIEPTETMLDALHDRILIESIPERQEANIKNDREVWSAVLDAAPDAPGFDQNDMLARAVQHCTETIDLAAPSPNDR